MSNKNKLTIFCCGNGFSGKDTFINILREILKPNNIELVRYSLADELKIISSSFIKELSGISVFSQDPKEKSLIRPLLVEIGRIKRKVSNGKYWTSLLTPKIKEGLNNEELPIISDLRYCDNQYPQDELWWAKNEFNGIIIYIERTLPDGRIVPPANKDEEINNIKLKESADYILRWPTTLDENIRIDCVKLQLKELIERIINGYK